MRKGDIYQADLEPAVGAEANKARPVVIVSRNAQNEAVAELGYGVVTVVPLTSKVERVLDFQTVLRSEDTGLPYHSKTLTEQVRSIAVERILGRVGSINAELTARIDDGLRLHLDL